MNRFRPQNLPGWYIMKQRLQTGQSDNYHWQTRVKWTPVGWKFNHRVIANQFQRLHYLARHSPAPVALQWAKTYKVFERKHFGTSRASVRYLNKHSCYSWL